MALLSLVAVQAFPSFSPGALLLAGLIGASLPPPHRPLGNQTQEDPEPGLPNQTQIPSQISGFSAGLALGLWMLPLLVTTLCLGSTHRLSQIGTVLTQSALTTFGGAYSTLPLIASRAVQTHQWFSPVQMLDGLALGEASPGPLLLVLQFYGFLAAHNAPEPFSPSTAASLGSLLALWCTFIPAMLWVLAAAPIARLLARHSRIQSGLRWIQFALVGSLAHLGIHMTHLEWKRHVSTPWTSLLLTLGVVLWKCAPLLQSKTPTPVPHSSGIRNRTETGR